MWKTWRAVPTNDSAWLITQAAFYFNHINEAFNLAARFTSRRCVAPLGSILDENSFSFPPHRFDSSSPTLLPRHPPIPRPPPRHVHSFALAKAARLIIYSYVSTENPPAVPTLITAPRLGLFTPVGSYLCVLPG